MDTILKVIFLYTPATFLETYTALRFLSVEAKVGDIVRFAVAQGLIIGLVRDVFDLFGPHFIILNTIHVLLTLFFLKIPVVTALLSKALGLFLVMIGEVYAVKTLLVRFDITMQDSMANPVIHILFGWIGHAGVVLFLAGHAIPTIWARSKGQNQGI